MGVGCHFLLRGIFLTLRSNAGLLHCMWIPYHLSHQGVEALIFCGLPAEAGAVEGWSLSLKGVLH